MNNFIIQLDVWCVISQMNFGFPLMFPSICISGQMCKAIFFCQRYLLLRLFLKWVRWKTDFLHIHVMYTQLILNCYFIFADVLAYFPKLVPSVGLCECVCLTKEENKKIIGSQPLGPSMFLLLGSFISRHIDF